MQMSALQRRVRPLAALRAAVSSLAFLAAAAHSAASAPVPAVPPASAPEAAWVHAYAAFGTPKYPRGYDHFEYLNPDAPKGGTLYLSNPDRRTSFDKYNVFTIKGNAPAGVGLYMLETLCFLAADETQTMYGLLAEEMQVAPDKSAITFRLHPKARFNNGDPVTAEDVKHSFDILTGKSVSPSYNSDYAGVARAVILDERTIRFELSEKSSDQLFKLGRLQVFSHKYGQKPDGSYKPFDQLIVDPLITSGPYAIALADSGRRIEFQRRPDYWARDLPVRRGMFNFDRVVYRYYQDEDVQTEAFKAGEFDLMRVLTAKLWERQLIGPKFDDGRIIKKDLPTRTGQGLQSYQLNMRRPVFADIRVRHAFALTYDFETNNRYPQFGLKRANSIFNNSEFAAEGLPSPGELKLLEPYRAELPREVFGPAFVARRTDDDPNALRRNLLEARALMEAAGWKLDANGVMRNPRGEPFAVEFLAPSAQDTDRRMNPWRHNLAKIGMTIRDRRVDYALFTRRLDEFDFDMAQIVETTFQLPAVADYVGYYGSKAADEKGSGNLRGIKSPAVDHILAAMTVASTLEDFRDACRALDRVVMWNWWQVPELYKAGENLVYWNKFGIPAVAPRHFQADQPPETDTQLAWPIVGWWAKSAERH